MLRTCPVDPRIKWYSERGELTPVCDRDFLEWAGVPKVTGRIFVGGTYLAWFGEMDPMLLAAADAIEEEFKRGEVAFICDDHRKLLVVWKNSTHYPNVGRGQCFKMGWDTWFIADATTLALDFREKMLDRRPLVGAPRGYVYVLKGQCDPPVYKIGRTKSMPSRLRALSTLTPFNVELIHVIPTDAPKEAEAFYHRLFSTDRLNGEWFQLSDLQAQYMLTEEEFEL